MQQTARAANAMKVGARMVGFQRRVAERAGVCDPVALTFDVRLQKRRRVQKPGFSFGVESLSSEVDGIVVVR